MKEGAKWVVETIKGKEEDEECMMSGALREVEIR
jgi:hypothetical protein